MIKTYACLKRRSLLKLICLVSAGIGLLISGCDHPSADSQLDNETTENKPMKSAQSTAEIRQQIPPLDLSQPREIKTATFALG